MNNSFSAAEQFKPSGKVIDIRKFGSGNINNTFLVTLDTAKEKYFILQNINTQVFRQPELVMLTMRIATEHIRRRLQHVRLDAGRRWEVPLVMPAKDGSDHWAGPDGTFWRAITFIDSAQSFDTIRNIEHAKEIGYALGMFHDLLSDLPADRLPDTLEEFHITPRYLKHYKHVLTEYNGSKSPDADHCIQFISKRSAWAHVLEDARVKGILHLRTIHGDPKVNNFMIDTSTGKAVSIIDLDTVKPGLVHYDIGDCLRSGCNPIGEETGNLKAVYFDLDLCKALLEGYLPMAKDFLTENDFEYLYDSIRLIAFELGLRFFTDFLQGNVYFRVSRPEHNLARALVQFKLTESIESQETAIRKIIRDIR